MLRSLLIVRLKIYIIKKIKMASNTKLWIKVDLPFCDKVDKYSKMFSIQFIEYGRFMRDIFDSFKTDSDLNLFNFSFYFII